jgi:hypothetical protein
VLIPVRQKFPHRALPDISAALHKELTESNLASRLPVNSRISIGVGSRGISNLAEIVRGVVNYFRAAGHRPFIFPAMGSHGAGTAEGQASVLAHYGVDEAGMGCPVESTFDIVSPGRTELGIDTFAGREAWESDAIFVVSRVKWHTSFAGALESGVSKMLAIGIGKREGATSVHTHGRNIGMEKAIRSVASHLLKTGKILGGLAILEDAFHDTAELAALPAEGLIAREEELLRRVKTWMVKIPLPSVDVLIVDQIGKNISGTGMDLKIVNRGTGAQINPWPDTTRVERIFVRDLSPLSYGNAVGIGVADVLNDRMLPKIDENAGRVNAVTSGSLALVRTPLHCATDRECFDLVAATVGKPDRRDVTVAWIGNTLDLEHLMVSENLRQQIEANTECEVTGPAFEMPFDEKGNLVWPQK